MSQKKKTFFSIFIIICLLTSWHYIGWLRPIENFFRRIISPASQIMYNISVKIGGEEQNFPPCKDIVTETANSVLKAENQELRRELNFLAAKKYKTLGAEVIGKNIDPVGNTIILNRGAKDQIKINNPVIVSEGFLIGKIMAVMENTSIVRLINDNQSKIAASINNNEEMSQGLVEGGYGISVQMNLIPQDETVKIGDTVMTSGLEEGIPRALLIGKVESVEKEAYHPFQTAILKPMANLEKIQLVSILLSK